eukprot:TRINITY_DN23318_c0_g1_i2.p1 TRINITY_DN23318_c0_g1~~TRINITY_DN23318_c0_g1_i2.p1  ORF type:complete len:390 (-),score=40.53 TRINITY_DN23318_c0_g1_i2:2-1102(-)
MACFKESFALVCWCLASGSFQLISGKSLRSLRASAGAAEQSAWAAATPSNTVTITKWFGRTGNNLEQLAHAIIYAESIGAQRLVLPTVPKKRGIHELFDLPDAISIAPNASLRMNVSCSNARDGDATLFYMRCVGAKRSDYKHVLINYVKPYLRPEAKAACAKDGKGFDGLTLHLRAGDLLDSKHPQARMLPCSFYGVVLRELGFTKLRLVSEPGKPSPCLQVLQRDKSVQVQLQSGSLAEDACALMTAQHLTYGLTTFAEAMALLNENLQSVAVPSLTYAGEGRDATFGSEGDPFGALGSCSDSHERVRLLVNGTFGKENALSGKTKYMLYNIAGFSHTRVGAEKISYMLRTKVPVTSKHRTCEP